MEKVVPYIHWRTILFGDTDAAGIVYTTRFTDYCMEAAECWFRDYLEIDWYQLNVEQAMGTPVVHMRLDFMASLIGNDKLGVEIRVSRVGTSTVTLEFEGIRQRAGEEQSTKTFTATIIFCFFSNEIDGATAIPDRQRHLLAHYCSDS